MDLDINIYINSHFSGFFPIERVEEMHEQYYSKALELAKTAEWDEIILYAIYLFDEETEKMISADFMSLCIPYDEYKKLYPKLSSGCRLFIINNRRNM